MLEIPWNLVSIKGRPHPEVWGYTDEARLRGLREKIGLGINRS